MFDGLGDKPLSAATLYIYVVRRSCLPRKSFTSLNLSGLLNSTQIRNWPVGPVESTAHIGELLPNRLQHPDRGPVWPAASAWSSFVNFECEKIHSSKSIVSSWCPADVSSKSSLLRYPVAVEHHLIVAFVHKRHDTPHRFYEAACEGIPYWTCQVVSAFALTLHRESG